MGNQHRVAGTSKKYAGNDPKYMQNDTGPQKAISRGLANVGGTHPPRQPEKTTARRPK